MSLMMPVRGSAAIRRACLSAEMANAFQNGVRVMGLITVVMDLMKATQLVRYAHKLRLTAHFEHDILIFYLYISLNMFWVLEF